MNPPKHTPVDVTRRSFLRHSSLAIAGTAAAMKFPFVLTSHAAADDPINVALIGLGGRGKGAGKNVGEAAPNVKIVALADIFPDQVDKAKADFPEVPAENCFSGFDCYNKAMAVPGVNYVILASPPGFRPMQLKAAVEAGKHVFMEKPVAVDGPGIRAVLAAGEEAAKKGLSIVGGTQRRHQPSYLETIKRINDGAVGDVMFMRVYWNGGSIWHRGYDPGKSELENQIFNWYHYVWLSGDHIVEQHMHNIDVGNWVMGNQHPVNAVGLGGRQALGDKTGHIWDHFAVEFEYENGVKMFSYARQITGCDGNVSEAVHGTKGISNAASYIRPKGASMWRYPTNDPKMNPNPYVQEHADLINAIRAGKPLNEAKVVVESTATAIMGREAAYSGQRVEWDDVMTSETVLAPPKLEFGPAPVPKPAMPGKHKPMAPFEVKA